MDQVHLLGHVACGQVNLLSMRVGNGPREDLLPPTRLQPYSMATTLLTLLQYSHGYNLNSHGYSPTQWPQLYSHGYSPTQWPQTYMATALLTWLRPFSQGNSPSYMVTALLTSPARARLPRPAQPCLPPPAYLWRLRRALCRLLELARGEQALKLLAHQAFCPWQVPPLGHGQRQVQVVELLADKGHHGHLVDGTQDDLATPEGGREEAVEHTPASPPPATPHNTQHTTYGTTWHHTTPHGTRPPQYNTTPKNCCAVGQGSPFRTGFDVWVALRFEVSGA